MEILYGAWRGGNTTVGPRSASPPRFSRSPGEEARRPAPPVPVSPADALRRDLAAIGAICRRVRGRLLRRERDKDVAQPSELAKTWAEAQGAFADLCAVMEERLAG